MTKKHNNLLLTACVIVKNNQDIIADCLESISFADEVLVIDTGSTDMTIDIAKKSGAKVIIHTTGSYDVWRTKGLHAASGTWLLYVDSDERVTPELRKEIQSIIKNISGNITAYAIPRRNYIFGKEFRYGGQRPDYQKRLFITNKLKKWMGKVHEEPVFLGELGHLENSIIHLKHSNLSDMTVKTNNWSEIEAKLMFDAHHPPMNLPRFASAVTREFWDKMIRKQGFRDGPEGIIYSLYQVFSKFVSYAKLWEMQEKGK